MRIFTCVILCTILLTSCVYRAMYHFEDEDMQWVMPYVEGDTVLFRSSSGLDTLIFNDVEIHDSYSPFTAKESMAEFHAIAYFHSTLKHKGNTIDVDVHIQRIDDSLLATSFFFADRYSWNDKGELPFVKSGILGAFGDVVRIDNSNSHMGDYTWKKSINCDYFYWSKSKGLLGYKYMDTSKKEGDVYLFYKKLTKR